MIYKIKHYLFAPRFHFNRLQFNLVILTTFIAGSVFGLYFLATGVLLPKIFATTTSSKLIDTSTQFSQGTLTSTAVSGSGAPAVVQLSGASGPDSTLYKRSITITNTGGALTNYQVLVTVDTATLITAGKLQSNCADIRFNDTNDSTAISNYWVDNCNSATTRIWVKVPSIAASPSTTTIYLYYGASAASAGSSFANTFTQPSGITGLQLWLKADAITGLANGAAVSTWTDSSGNGYNATQSTGASQPSYQTNVINGQPVVRFDGNDSLIHTLGYASGQANSSFSVAKRSTGAVDWQIILYVDQAPLTARSNDSVNWATYQNININSSASIDGTFKILANITRNYNDLDLVTNGLKETKTIGTSWFSSTGNRYIASTNGNAQFLTGDIAEVFTYNVALSESNRQLIERYLAAKYNITLTSTEPSTSVGSESITLSASGTWESPTDSNVIDLVWNGGWGDGTAGSTAFSATVASVGTNNTITFSMKTAASTAALSAASYVSLGTVSTGTTFTKTKAELDALGIGTGSNRYVQVRASLAQTSGTNPQLDSFTISYLSDNTAPETNASGLAMLRNSGGTTVSSNGWTNNSSPYFSWTAGSDSQAGLKGYCLYLGADSAGNPATSKGLLGTSPVSTTNTTCQFIVSATNIDFATTSYRGSTWITTSSSPYYLNVKAVDNGGNLFATSAQFQFRFDNTVPTNTTYISCASGNFSNVVDMSFNWPTTGSAASSDSNSDLLGWQYQINSTAGTWLGTTTESTVGVNNYIPTSATSRTLTSAQDSSSIVSGTNVVYFRTADIAGNTSSDATIRTCNISYGGAAPAFGSTDTVTVTPSTSTSNSYALSWPAATPSGSNTVAHYYYMVNTAPPSTLATLQGNAATYVDNGTTRTVAASALAGVNKGTNTVYVVAIDNASTPNYSPSNYITGTFTLNSTDPDNVGSLVASDSSIKASSQWNVTLTWVAPTYQGAGNLTYLVKRSTDGTTFTQVGTTSGLSYVDNTPSSAKYYYKIYTKDGAAAQSSGTNAVSITPTGKWTSAPTLSTGPSAGSITTTKSTITWTTSRTADSKISYGTTSGSYGSVEPSNSDQVSSHSIQLTGLTAGTTYYYKAKWTDEDGNTGTSDEKSFTTTSAPSVKDVSTKSIGLTTATIQFTSSNASKVKIYYGKTTSFGGTKEVATSTTETTYTVDLSGLDDGVKYYYKINTFDSDSIEYTGTVLDFTTLPRPKISNVRIQQVANTAQSTLLVSWNTNTEVSSIVTYYPEGNPAAARDEVNVTLTRGEHKMIVRSLLPQTDYLLVVKGRDKIGNEASSDSQRLTTATDTRPPQISDLQIEGSNIPPVGTTAQEQTAQLIVSWNTDEPSTGQVEYGEGTGTTYAQKTQEDSNLTFNHLVIISGLTPSKVYHLRAASKDKAGNLGNSIDSVTITPKATENALNLVISNLQEAFGFLGGLGK